MQKVIKTICLIALSFSTVVFLLVGYAQISFPDEINVTSVDSISSGAIFTYNIYGEESKSNSIREQENLKMNIKLFDVIPIKTSGVKVSRRRYVCVCGTTFGIRLYTDGVMVIGSQAIETDNGNVYPGKEAGIQSGDIIKVIDRKKITSSDKLAGVVRNSNGKELKVELVRNSKKISVNLKPVKCKSDGNFKAGLWVRDSTAGIGTMTFYDRDTGVFAGLGHAVCDVDTGKIMPISDGDAVEAQVKGCYKGTNGTPGELCGIFSGGSMGKLYINGETGVFGLLDSFDENAKVLPVALPREIEQGKAQILATVDDDIPKFYDVEIEKIFKSENTVKNMVVKITDEELIGKTGGIVQGMSGTPIIQNGMLVGAITHVFVGNPKQGYAIYAENMVVTADNVSKKDFLNKAS